MYKRYSCYHCDAVFNIKHSLDEKYYEVMFCPFCGSDIEETEDEIDDYE